MTTPRYFSVFDIATLAFVLTLVFSPITKAEQSAAVAVFYPDLQEPYRNVVSSIVEGIQEKIKEPVGLFTVGEGIDLNQLKATIDREDIAVIVALGRTGLAAAQQWKGKIPIVAGALLLTPDKKDRGIAGISLSPDPDVFYSYLEQLAPAVKRVHVVYNTQNSAWLVQTARTSAAKKNFHLITNESNDIKNSALIYRDIISKSRPGEDAIWLLPDPVAVDDKVILPLLLREAWDQGILIFSSNPTYVRRGALFALFPDNKKMGEDLAILAESYVNTDTGNIANNIVPLRALQAAINVRTAEHIGLSIPNDLLRKFSLVFPEH